MSVCTKLSAGAGEADLPTEAPLLPTSRGLSLRAGFSWTLAGNIVYAGCQWAMVVVLAKLGSPETVGQFGLGLAVTAPVMLFANLHLPALLATDCKGEYRFGHYLALRLVTIVLALATIAALAVNSGYGAGTALVIVIVGLAKAFESAGGVFHGLLQRLGHLDWNARSGMYKGLLSLATLAVGAHFHGAVGAAVGLAIAWLLVLGFYDIPCAVLAVRDSAAGPVPPEGLRPLWEWRRVSALAWLALPGGIIMLLISLTTNIPRYFIGDELGEAALGIFVALAYFMVAVAMVTSALGQAATPLLARHHAGGDQAAFMALTFQLIGMGFLVGAAGLVVAWLGGREILTLAYAPEYAEHTPAFLWLMAAAALNQVGSALGYAVTARRQLRAQPIALGLVMLVTAVSCYLLLPVYGLTGAAISLLISSVVHVMAYTVLLICGTPPREPRASRKGPE